MCHKIMCSLADGTYFEVAFQAHHFMALLHIKVAIKNISFQGMSIKVEFQEHQFMAYMY